MNTLIVYDTYSNSTKTAANFLQKHINDHAITSKRVLNTTEKDFDIADFVVFATPSWYERSLEGQPHIHFLEWMDAVSDHSFKNISFSALGLGIDEYADFCGGIDKLAHFLTQRGAVQTGGMHKINGYFFNLENNNKKLHDWWEEVLLLKKLENKH